MNEIVKLNSNHGINRLEGTGKKHSSIGSKMRTEKEVTME